VHRLCALVLVLFSCVSVQAQNSSLEEGLYFDDCLGTIIEPSADSPQALATEPRVEESARGTSAEVIQPSDEPQIADQSDQAVQPEIQNAEISTNGSTIKNLSPTELARVIERILDEAMQPGDDCPAIDGAEKTWTADNLTNHAGELTALAGQSPAQIVTSESAGVSNRAEGEVLNTFYQDLE
jgi:hypothetical protein